MTKRVLVRGPALSRTGYGEHCRFVLRALRKHEDRFDIFLLATTWGQGGGWSAQNDEEKEWIYSILAKTQEYIMQPQHMFDISIQVTIPNEVERLAPYNVLVTAGIETTKIDPSWVEPCNHVDKIIVPSEFAKEVFELSQWDATIQETGQKVRVGVTTPIDVVQYPARDLECEEIPETFPADFNFLCIAQWCPRKNLENTIRWFVEEFHEQEDVGLVLKLMLRNNSRIDREYTQKNLEGVLSQFPDRKCKVTLLHGELSDKQMIGLMQHPQIKCMINLAHGECFGLPMFEAAQVGLPLIAVGWGGHCDFLFYDKKVAKRGSKKKRLKTIAGFYPVDFTLGPVQQHALQPGLINQDSQWAYAKEASFKSALSNVRRRPQQAEERAEALRSTVLRRFCLDSALDKLADSVYVNSEAERAWAAKVEAVADL